MEHHPLEQALRKASDVEETLKETLAMLDSIQGEFIGQLYMISLAVAIAGLRLFLV